MTRFQRRKIPTAVVILFALATLAGLWLSAGAAEARCLLVGVDGRSVEVCDLP